MFKGKPILAGSSDLNQAQLIFSLVGAPTEENMPGFSSLPGCEGIKNFGNKPGNLQEIFKEQSPTAVSLLTELLKLDWRKRINAIDALNHPYFLTAPLPAEPGELPHFEDSHELDRRKFRGQRAAMPPAPAGGSVGIGANAEWASANSAASSGASLDQRNSRIPAAARFGRDSSRPPRGMDGRPREHRPDCFRHAGGDDNNRDLQPWQKDTGLPPKPALAYQNWGESQSGRTDAEHGQRQDWTRQGRLPEANVDTSLPNHDNVGDHLRTGESEVTWQHSTAESRDGGSEYPRRMNRRWHYRDHYPRRRSRSPFRGNGSNQPQLPDRW